METEYLQFLLSERPPYRKTDVWYVAPKAGGSTLGQVRFFSSWRKYCFFPKQEVETIFDPSCMRAIADFCESKTEEWRKALP